MASLHQGHCTCGYVKYELSASPLIVHCCHCTWCQRETGSAFATNAVIEDYYLHIVSGEVETIDTPTKSGRGQKIVRCPKCHIALWSLYSHKRLFFIRVGTLIDPNNCPPDVHIYTSTKLPWVTLPESVPAYKGFYARKNVWSEESMQRVEQLNASKK